MSTNPVPSTIRLPLFWGSATPGAQTPSAVAQVGLLIGPAEANAGVPKVIISKEQADSIYGRGSILSIMCAKFMSAYRMGTLKAIGVANSTGTAATKTITFTASGTNDAGTARIWVNSDYIDVPIAANVAQNALATAAAALLPSVSDLPFTAAAPAANIVTATCRHKGTIGNTVRIALDEDMALPSGITCVIAAGVTGATDTAMSDTITAMGDMQADKIGLAWDGQHAIDIAAEIVSRWGYDRQVFGFMFSGVAGTETSSDKGYGTLYTLATGSNSQAYVAAAGGLESYCRAAGYEVAAQLAAVCMQSDEADPGLKVGSLTLPGCKSAAQGKQFNATSRNTLLYNGITTFHDVGGVLCIDRCVTRRTKNTYGSRDESQYDAGTIWLLQYLMRDLRATIENTYGRCRLVSDSTGTVPANCVTPNMMKGTLIAWYERHARAGLVENPELFAANVEVVRPAGDPNRLDATLPVDVANNLEVFAPLIAFQR